MCLTSGQGKMILDCNLCSRLCRVNGILFAMYNVVVDAIFDIGVGIRNAIEPLGIRFILSKQQLRGAITVKKAFLAFTIDGLDGVPKPLKARTLRHALP